MDRTRCVNCGKEFEVDHNFAGRSYFCSDECDEAYERLGYVVLKCDGTIKATECNRATRIDGDIWPAGTRLLAHFGRRDPLCGVGDMRICACQVGFDTAALDARANRVVWALDDTLVFGDVIVAGRYDYCGGRYWMPFAAAEKLADELRAKLAEAKPRPIPENLLADALIDNDNPAFFERCYRRGLWGLGFVAFALFTDKNDRALVDQISFRRDVDVEDMVQPDVVVNVNDGWLCAMRIPSCCLHDETPINEFFCGSFYGRRMNEAVKSGRVKFYAGFWLDSTADLARFRQEEADLEGKKWKVLFQGQPELAGEDSCVAIGTSLPIKWLDKTPWSTINACGDFKSK